MISDNQEYIYINSKSKSTWIDIYKLSAISNFKPRGL